MPACRTGRSERVRTRSAVVRWGFVLGGVLGVAASCRSSAGEDRPDRPAVAIAVERRLHTGHRLTEELDKPLNFVLNRTSPRVVVRRLSELHHVAIFLDRRIDPDQTLDVQLVQTTLREGLELFAVQLEAQLTQIGGTLFIGPSARTDPLRTRMALRMAEIRDLAGEDSAQRRSDLLKGRSISWAEVTIPAELLDQLLQMFELESAGEALPHDLWGAGQLVDVNAPEALSLVLGQFDMTFAWDEAGQSIQLVAAPPRETIAQSHAPHGMTVAEAISQIRAEWPHLQPEASGRRVLVSATVGEHEAIDRLVAPPPATPAAERPREAPLSARRFTMTARRAEAIAIIRTLESQQVTVQYDPEVLRRAGIDLRTSVTVELNQAPAEELFRALCDPLGLTFTIVSDSERLIRLAPKTVPERDGDR